MHIRRHGDLVVAERDRLSDQINRKLKEIDSRLFLEKQIRLRDQHPCWYVMFEGDLSGAPDALFEWSGPDGVPLELSWSIVDRVIAGRLDRSPRAPIAHTAAMAANDAKRKEMDEDSMYEHLEIARELIPKRGPGYSPVLHRGVGLRMSRDKKRSQGWKI